MHRRLKLHCEVPDTQALPNGVMEALLIYGGISSALGEDGDMMATASDPDMNLAVFAVVNPLAADLFAACQLTAVLETASFLEWLQTNRYPHSRMYLTKYRLF